ncbi:long-chain-fatty-acid--coa ligase [Holotrichia oblita]|uniref:Long-chain-fatty-acid--coa ligase n=1 Tax=Holotrichia oblita TaxID=644536 RepID=A0ACB9TXB9_HOLOL|nr:long-chain-fatty-acid--coa ligase [Holotrichia oblita]
MPIYLSEYLLPNQGDNIIRTPNQKYEFSEKSLGVVLFKQMKKYSDDIAQIDAVTEASDTHGMLLKRSIRTAVEMQNRGVTKGDIICICSSNNLNSCVPYLAGLFIGAKVSALDPIMSYEDMKHLLNQVPPSIIFAADESEQSLKEIISDLNLLTTDIIPFNSIAFEAFLSEKLDENEFKPVIVNDVFETAVIFFSSGTTGLAKGICINHYTLLQQSPAFKMLGFDLNIVLSFASLYWISAINLLISSLLYGQTRLLVPDFDEDQTWQLIDKFKVTTLLMSSTQATLLIKSNKPPHLKFESLKHVTIGGAPVSLNLFNGLEKTFPRAKVIQGYGWTEVGGIITISSPNSSQDLMLLENKPLSCGRPIPGIWYKLVDLETEKALGPNKRGELRLKTDYQMNGYYNMDSSNAWDSQGWIRTGDICYYDEDYCFYVIDRLKELIKYRGWHVSPALLEGILVKHPAVKMAVVIGVPHDQDNEHPLALVMLTNKDNNTINEDQLRKFVDDQVDDNKKLRAGVRFIEDMPKTPTGKVRRYFLKMQILSQIFNNK